jgi:integrase
MFSKDETDTQNKWEIGRVTVRVISTGYLQARWRVDKKNYSLTFGKYNKPNLDDALAMSRKVDSDITYRDFDPTLERYRARTSLKVVVQPVAEIKQKEWTIKEVWEFYCKINENISAEATKIKVWKPIEKVIENGSKYLDLKQTFELVLSAKEIYADGNIEKMLKLLRAACNTAIEAQKISYNPYTEKVWKLLSLQDKDGDYTKQCYSREQINLILRKFYQNIETPEEDEANHSYYAKFVHFRALTGCRIEEAIALRWENIKVSGGRKYIVFSEAYSYGEIRGTKNGTIRQFPCNDQLSELIDSIEKTKSPLVFPALKGGHLQSNNFSRRHWNRVVGKLVKDGLLDRYLPFYNLRHSFITQLVRSGIDIATIAAWCGNSEQTILKHYLASNKDLIPPVF